MLAYIQKGNLSDNEHTELPDLVKINHNQKNRKKQFDHGQVYKNTKHTNGTSQDIKQFIYHGCDGSWQIRKIYPAKYDLKQTSDHG